MTLGRRALALALFLPQAASAQPAVDHKQGVLGHLSAQIGTTNTPIVLNDAAVRRNLSLLLGDPGVRLLMTNLQVVAPIAFDGTALVLRGARMQAEREQEAFLSIRPRDGIMEVAILTAGRVRFVSQRPSGERSEMLDPQLARWGVSRGVPLDERRVPPSVR
ncbi:MAG: hypothetical protein WCP77_18175 [Roseococcus sp.]